MEPREVFLEDMRFEERPTEAVVESPEDFWERIEDMESPLVAMLVIIDTLSTRRIK